MSHEREPTVPDVISDVTSDRAADAFALLGNETRLSILLALWDAYEPFDDDNAVSFSTLRERVGMRDSGQFNYHLDKLTDHYIDATDDGYKLREAGHRIIQSVLAAVGIEEPSFEETSDLSTPCPACGSNVRFEYADRNIKGYCPECPPPEGSDEDDRLVMDFTFDPAGVATRSVDEVLIADEIQRLRGLQMNWAGVCDSCSGSVEFWFEVCENHTAPEDGRCEECDRNSRVQLRTLCTVCKASSRYPGGIAGVLHPKALVFFIDHGDPYGFGADRTPSIAEYNALGEAIEVDSEVVSDDPFRCEIRIMHESGDELEIVFNDDVEVIETTRQPAPADAQ